MIVSELRYIWIQEIRATDEVKRFKLLFLTTTQGCQFQPILINQFRIFMSLHKNGIGKMRISIVVTESFGLLWSKINAETNYEI